MCAYALWIHLGRWRHHFVRCLRWHESDRQHRGRWSNHEQICCGCCDIEPSVSWIWVSFNEHWEKDITSWHLPSHRCQLHGTGRIGPASKMQGWGIDLKEVVAAWINRRQLTFESSRRSLTSAKPPGPASWNFRIDFLFPFLTYQMPKLVERSEWISLTTLEPSLHLIDMIRCWTSAHTITCHKKHDHTTTRHTPGW